eukprot:CAMPEP_0174729754 /NCGR_PEP_ID=MMETSP1094-20130205/54309_1 /TAXON_ID=156173 /ORGANISM="Chrysochromulina brevifilum, Strain UTEX LB 985" /LENGTH=109 /DNA_ID=CAMNT_0015931913 /DNA_START=18 /DNA_END=347 /DNA_ORIENTATION=+
MTHAHAHAIIPAPYTSKPNSSSDTPPPSHFTIATWRHACIAAARAPASRQRSAQSTLRSATQPSPRVSIVTSRCASISEHRASSRAASASSAAATVPATIAPPDGGEGM